MQNDIVGWSAKIGTEESTCSWFERNQHIRKHLGFLFFNLLLLLWVLFTTWEVPGTAIIIWMIFQREFAGVYVSKSCVTIDCPTQCHLPNQIFVVRSSKRMIWEENCFERIRSCSCAMPKPKAAQCKKRAYVSNSITCTPLLLMAGRFRCRFNVGCLLSTHESTGCTQMNEYSLTII